MKILNKFKGILVAIMALGIFLNLGTKNTYATESNITSGIYEVENGNVKNLPFTINECRGYKRSYNLYYWFFRKWLYGEL